MKTSLEVCLSLIVIGLSSASPSAQSQQAKSLAVPCEIVDQRITTLLGEYKELRQRRTQLAPGSFDKGLSDAGGRLSKVLSSLGDELGHPPFTEKVITACMGEPDAIRSHAEMGSLLEIYNREQQKTGHKIESREQRKYLIYFWRGWHDFLFFISEDGVIVDHGWWFAYE